MLNTYKCISCFVYEHFMNYEPIFNYVLDLTT